MSPVMVGRARPFARLAGIVDAAEVMTSEQPAVALVSGEPGIGKTRLVRELVESLPGRVTTVAVTAQPGSMGRPLDAVASLVAGGQPSSAFIEALHRRSAGIPFVIEELMRVVGPRAIVSDLLDAELPWSLEEALRVVTEASDADLIDALRSLTSAGVVVEVSDDKFWFSHALVADAIVHQLLGRERRRLHERCFEVVRLMPTLDHASLAYHARGAERHDEIPAIARRGAAKYLEKGLTFAALRLADEGLAEAPNDPELLAVATEAAWRLDFLDEALATGLRWVKVAVEPSERIDALRFTARLQHEHRNEPEALARIADLQSLRSTLDDRRLRGVAAWSLAQLHMIAGRSAEATRWAEEALSDARAVGDQLTEARALVERAGACIVMRARADSLRMFFEALEAARQSGDAVLLTRAI